MKRFSKLAIVLAAVSGVVSLGLSPALADSPGQLEGGAFVYQAKNLTSNGTYANTLSANACDELQYRVWLHNTEFSALNDVTVKVSLPSAKATSNTSTMTATTAAGGTTGTSGSTTVNISSAQTISYENGSAELHNQSGGVIGAVSDSITGSGADLGTLNGSTTEYVTFKAKVSCETPQVAFACTALDVNKIDRTHYDFTAHGSVQNATIQSYGFTAKNSAGSTVDTKTVNTSATSAIYHFNQSNPGTYTVSAMVNTDHGSAGGDNCVKQVTVTSTPPTPNNPAPTVLPNTGPGDILGAFTGASVAGTAVHYAVSRRRQ